MNNTVASIEQLRDIQLPAAISAWWPLAPGWYIVAALAVLLLIGGSYFIYRLLHKHQRRQQWQQQLHTIQIDYQQTKDTVKTLSEISILIRRIMLVHYPRQDIAALHGNAWLTFLDQTVEDKSFSQGVGKILVEGPYQKLYNADLNEFFMFIQKWMKKMYV